MINEAQVRTFNERGWLVVEEVYRPDESDEVARLAVETADSMDVDESMEGYLLDRSETGESAPRKIDSPYLRNPVFRNFALDGRLRVILRQLTGEEPLLKSDQLFMKPPRFGSEKPYHQDNFYFRCTPGGHVITAWIALDDVDEENGCLRYISGSHKKGIIDHVEVPGQPYNLAPRDDLIDWENGSLRTGAQGRRGLPPLGNAPLLAPQYVGPLAARLRDALGQRRRSRPKRTTWTAPTSGRDEYAEHVRAVPTGRWAAQRRLGPPDRAGVS